MRRSAAPVVLAVLAALALASTSLAENAPSKAT